MFLIYLDPSSGSILLQLAIAALAGAGIVIGASWSKLKRFFKRFKKKADVGEDKDDEDEDGEG